MRLGVRWIGFGLVALSAWGTSTAATADDGPGPLDPEVVATAERPDAATATVPSDGYWMLDADGSVHAFGAASTHPVVNPVDRGGPRVTDIEPSMTGQGYWVLDEGGYAQPHGDAWRQVFVDLQPGERAVDLYMGPVESPAWIFTSRGRVLGGPSPYGDLAGTVLNAPIVDAVVTPSLEGYYMVGADGGIFAFGDAAFYGSMGGQPLNAPVVGLAPTPAGYRLVASDGGIFAFGDATFHGSMGGQRLNAPVVGAVTSDDGYLMVAADGGIFSFGPTRFHGSLGDQPPDSGVVAVATTPDTAVTVPLEIAGWTATQGIPPDGFAFAWEEPLGTYEDAVDLMWLALAAIEAHGVGTIEFTQPFLIAREEGRVTTQQYRWVDWLAQEAVRMHLAGVETADF